MLMPPPQTRVKRLFEAIGVATGATGAEDGETNESKKWSKYFLVCENVLWLFCERKK